MIESKAAEKELEPEKYIKKWERNSGGSLNGCLDDSKTHHRGKTQAEKSRQREAEES